MTTHRILGMDFVDKDQNRLDGIGVTFKMPRMRFPGVESDVICCVYDLISHLEEMEPRVQKPRRGICIILTSSFDFNQRHGQTERTLQLGPKKTGPTTS